MIVLLFVFFALSNPGGSTPILLWQISLNQSSKVCVAQLRYQILLSIAPN